MFAIPYCTGLQPAELSRLSTDNDIDPSERASDRCPSVFSYVEPFRDVNRRRYRLKSVCRTSLVFECSRVESCSYEGICIAPAAAPPKQQHCTPRSNLNVLEETKVARPAFLESKLLSELSTWGVGGPAKYFIEVCSETDLVHVLRYCNQSGIRVFVVGKGSNCLFDDRGFDGCVILNRIEYVSALGGGVYEAGGGYPFNQLGIQCSKEGYTGLEFAAGIPGTVGGAVYMNAGADGQETSAVLHSVDFVTETGERKTFHQELGEVTYGYRHSPFQSMEGPVVIAAARFQLTSCVGARKRQIDYMDRRRKSQPVVERTAGCVFRNPAGCDSAGAIIDQLGLKGLSIGGACVSELHANFLINKGNGKCTDMLTLISLIKQRVMEERGVELNEEIQYVPYR